MFFTSSASAKRFNFIEELRKDYGFCKKGQFNCLNQVMEQKSGDILLVERLEIRNNCMRTGDCNPDTGRFISKDRNISGNSAI